METPEAKSKAAVYTREQLLGSKKYAGRRDLISVLLDGDKGYTLSEADGLIEKYMKGEVR